MGYQLGDRVRIDIPDETDPDFELHGEHGLVISVERSQSCEHNVRYELTLKNLDYEFTIELHSWNLRPPIEPMLPIESLSPEPTETL